MTMGSRARSAGAGPDAALRAGLPDATAPACLSGASALRLPAMEEWRGPAIVGLLHSFADPEIEAAYLQSQAPSARRRLFAVICAAALVVLFSVTVAVSGGFNDTANVVFFGPALTQLAICGGFTLLLLAMPSRTATEFVAAMFAIVYLGVRCTGINTLPALAESSAAMIIGTIWLLYGVPLRLAFLAPLLAAGSAAMVAAWVWRSARPPNAAIVQMSEWVVISNLLGFFSVRTYRHTLRRQWAQTLALRHMAAHDGLTGVANRRHFEETLAREWAAARAETSPVSLILLDVDFFKLLNDGIGHHAGDSCLRDLAVILQNALTEPGHLLARIGGEEFAVLLPGRDGPQAGAVARRVMAAVREARMAHPCSPVGPHLTVSLGVATAFPASGASTWELTALADQMVYAAKREGRNCLRQDILVPRAVQSGAAARVAAL